MNLTEDSNKLAMVARDLISDLIPPLRTSDTGEKALAWMEEFKVAHLPIVNNVDFLGLISESDILDMNDPAGAIGNHSLSLYRPYVYDYQHIYDVLKVLSTQKLSLIPVLDENEKFLGNIHLTSLLEHFAEMASMKDAGGLLVLELNVNDYSLAEIARIVESNDAKILSLYISSHSDSTKLELTLKINRIDLSGILQTFYRYNYSVKASFHQSEHVDDLKERFDAFMKFIDL
jgi:acetoin utilization protein AcuB